MRSSAAMLCMMAWCSKALVMRCFLFWRALVKAVPFTAQLSASEPQPVKKISAGEALMALATCARPVSTNSLAS